MSTCRTSGGAHLVVVLLALGLAQQRTIAEGATKPHLIGLLNLPEIVGTEGCGAEPPASANLYDRPSTATAPIGSIEEVPASQRREVGCAIRLNRVGKASDELLPTAESAYEIPAAIVYERAGRWFRIALRRGSAWIARDDPRDFLPYPALLVDRGGYLPADWDGRLWEAPGGTAPTKKLSSRWKPYVSERITITFLGARRVGTEVWMRVRLETTEVCGDQLKGVTPIEGWLPAYQPSGDTMAWFYSRGC